MLPPENCLQGWNLTKKYSLNSDVILKGGSMATEVKTKNKEIKFKRGKFRNRKRKI